MAMKVGFSTFWHPPNPGRSCLQIFPVGFGQFLERALVLIGSARSCPVCSGSQLGRDQDVRSQFIGRARSSRFSQKPALATPTLFAASSALSWRIVLPVWIKAAEFLVLRDLRLTIHSSRTRFVASRLRLGSRAGRLNSRERRQKQWP